jgi:signal transduction histidine kinase
MTRRRSRCAYATTGRGAATPALDESGYGIVGMRERAAMFDGVLEAGPLPAGGYRVRARLPLEPERTL